jgi:diguanylate cyclase (GGDEF)-like protein/PAS domain S-box-containing protein
MPLNDRPPIEQHLLRTLGDNTLDLIYAKDKQGHYTFVNSALLRFLGIQSREDVLGKNDFDFHPKATAQQFYDDEQRVISSKTPLVNREEQVRNPTTGESRWHSTTKVPLFDGHGETIGILGITRDITTTKEAEFAGRKINATLEERIARHTGELEALKETLQNERNLMRTLIDSIPNNIFAKDTQSKFLLANQFVARGMGSTPEDLLGKDDFDFFPEEMAQRFFDDEQHVIQTGEPLLNLEEPAVDKETGQIRWLLTSKVPLRDHSGQVVGLVGIGRDITARREAERASRENEDRFRSLADLSSEWYWEQGPDLQFIAMTHANGKADYKTTEVIGKTLQQLPDTYPLSGSWQEYEALVAEHRPFRDVELRRDTGQGEPTYLSLSGLPILDHDGVFQGYRGIGRDITDRKQSEEQAYYLATHDSLTGLPNRTMFSQILNIAIESARRFQRKLAVIFIDLDRFKNINDTLGHEAGDTLLKDVAQRLSNTLRSCDVVARLGGDEFVVLVQELDDTEQAVKVARKILSATINPVSVLDQEISITASIGICMYPDDAEDEQTLMKNADIAMYRAKDEGKNTYQFYSPDIKARSLERLMLENNLRLALERDEFFLHYQAKRDLKTGAIAGVEALVRWQHPKLGVVSPAQFIPLAEETGLIVLIGRWVLKTACAQNVAWQKQGLPPLCMAVNLSVRQFFDEGLVDDVSAALEESGMDPGLLEMEITEGMVMQDSERATRILTDIKALGVRLAIDDFGVGYSSLAQIKRFPIDTLKVDGSFIREIPKNLEDRAITEAIIAMGRTLSLTVVAEGVETVEQETFLRDHACDQSQGYYFSRPITSDEFVELMKQQPEALRNYPPKVDTTPN